jgi:hypothetical protein
MALAGGHPLVHRVTWANVAAHSLLHFGEDELSGLALEEIFSGETGAALLEDSLPVVAAGGRFCGAAILTRKDGTPIAVSATGTAIGGDPDLVIWILLESTTMVG